MESINIEEHDGFPKVILDAENEVYFFGGKSLPENAREFFGSILDWIVEYAKDPNPETKVVFKMDYFNTASSKRILDVLEKFEKIHKSGKSEVEIDWLYLDIDEDMLHAGTEYANIIDVPMNIISYD